MSTSSSLSVNQKGSPRGEAGIAHLLLILLAAAGLIIFLLFSSSADFKNKLFNYFFPNKTKSIAAPRVESVPDELLIKFKAGVDTKAKNTIRHHYGLKKQDEIDKIKVERVKINPKIKTKIMDALKKNPRIEFVEENYLAKPRYIPNDPAYLSAQWNLKIIQAPQAYDIPLSDSNIIIALGDTGVNPTHPDLQGSLALPGHNFVDNNDDTTDTNGHGTILSGVAVAQTNNGIGIAAVALGLKVMPLKVCGLDGGCSYYDIANSARYAADQGIRVISFSLGGGASSATLQSAMDYAWSKNSIIVASSGNSGREGIEYPAAANHVIAVGATTGSDILATFSNWGPQLDLVAPGQGIYGTTLAGAYGSYNGTSYSVHVSALAGLIFAVNPSLTNQQVEDIIKTTADKIGTYTYDSNGWNDHYGYGRINVCRAVARAKWGDESFCSTASSTNDTSPPSQPTNLTAVAISPNRVDLSWTASIDNIGVYGYYLYKFSNVIAIPDGSAISYIDNDVLPGTSYAYQIVAFDKTGNKSYISNDARVTTPTETPTPTSTPLPTSTPTPAPTSTPITEAPNTEPITPPAAGAPAPTSEPGSGGGEIAPDTTSPSVNITSPSSGSTISGLQDVNINASDDTAVTKVELYIDDVKYAETVTSPYLFSLDTTKYSNGSHTIYAKGYDLAGNIGTSSSISVNISNIIPDRTAPQVSITTPLNNQTVTQTTTITASASDNVGISSLSTFVDGVLVDIVSATTDNYSWDTTKETNSQHTITASALDTSNNPADATPVSVVVNNPTPTPTATATPTPTPTPTPDTTPPTVSITSPLNGATVIRNSNFTISANASDNIAVSKVEFYVDNSLKSTDTASPYTYTTKITGRTGAPHTITAKAYDTSSKTAQASVTVKTQ